MSYALIQGSSKGIGLALVRSLLKNTKLDIIATTSSGAADARHTILDDKAFRQDLSRDVHRRLTTLDMDVSSENHIKHVSETVLREFGRNLRLLVNVSGILHAERSISEVKSEELTRSFQINAIGHLLVYKHFLPLLPARQPPQLEDGNRLIDVDPASGLLPSHLSAFVSLTARVGSIGDNRSGCWYSYRSSKSATNQIIRTLAHELEMKKYRAIAYAYHPGTVKTDLSNPYVGNKEPDIAKGLFSPRDAAGKFLDVLKAGVKNGSFVDWKGSVVPW